MGLAVEAVMKVVDNELIHSYSLRTNMRKLIIRIIE